MTSSPEYAPLIVNELSQAKVENHKARKREDIQVLRGVAIIGVLFFHVWPYVFPNGFLGVDVFFVLSGYLMSSMLSSQLTVSSVKEFYIRRVKRIAPLYALTLLLTTIVAVVVLLDSEWKKYRSDLAWALPFMTNVRDSIWEESYWAQLRQVRLLTHTWSLGVEIQYYIIVPFIVAGRRLVHPILYYCFLCGGSLILMSQSKTAVAFNFMPCRIWQFLAGALAYEGECMLKKDEETKEEQSTMENCRFLPVLCAVFLTLILLNPFPVPYTLCLRILSIITTAVSILLAGLYSWNIMTVLRPIRLLGDFSYNLYLLHWPILIFIKYAEEKQDPPIAIGIVTIVFLLVIAYLCWYYIESPLAKLSKSNCVIFMLAIYSLLIVLCSSPVSTIIRQQFVPRLVHSSAFNWNVKSMWLMTGRNYKECSPVPSHLNKLMTVQGSTSCFKEFNQSLPRVLLLGNSIAHLAEPTMYEMLKSKAGQFLVFTRGKCNVLLFSGSDHVCNEYTKAAHKVVEAFKPDIVFIINMHYRIMYKPLAIRDSILTEMQNNLQFIRNHSNIIVVDGPIPEADTFQGVAGTMAKRLRFRQEMGVLQSSLSDFKKANVNVEKRLKMLNVSGYIYHDVAKSLFRNGRDFQWYNSTTLHSLYTDNVHFTEEGMRILNETYVRVIEDAFETLGLRS